MNQTVRLRRSAVEGKVPSTADLELGEVAINTFDGKVYIKKEVNGTETIVDVTDRYTRQEIDDMLSDVWIGNMDLGTLP